MNRRDFLKVSAAGLAYATVMTNDLFGQVIREFGKNLPSKGRNLCGRRRFFMIRTEDQSM